MVFKGFKILVEPREKDYANEGFIYASTDTSHYWALLDISTNQVILKSPLLSNREEAIKQAKSFAERIVGDISQLDEII